jgi:hypothetical protein
MNVMPGNERTKDLSHLIGGRIVDIGYPDNTKLKEPLKNGQLLLDVAKGSKTHRVILDADSAYSSIYVLWSGEAGKLNPIDELQIKIRDFLHSGGDMSTIEVIEDPFRLKFTLLSEEGASMDLFVHEISYMYPELRKQFGTAEKDWRKITWDMAMWVMGANLDY